MSFAPSLHPVSLVRAIRASAGRTPDKIAVAGEDRALSYAQLVAEAGGAKNASIRIQNAPQAASVVGWLAGMMAAETQWDENDPAAILPDGRFSHRELALRALNSIVEHAAFGRERAVLATALPLGSPRGLVAATISLWLGSTLQLLKPGNAASIIEGIESGRFETAWFGVAEFDQLQGPLPEASEKFRLAICDGLPSAHTRALLLNWLGATRVTAETGSVPGGNLFRHPGLVEKGEPFVGSLCA